MWRCTRRSAAAAPATSPNVHAVQEDLSWLDAVELERRVAELRERMRPLEHELAGLRGQRDVFLTELRRRRRLAERTSRADLKASMKEGPVPTVAGLVAGTEGGSLAGFVYKLKTRG